MKKKLLKVFFMYSYISAISYIASENSLILAKHIVKNGNTGNMPKMKIESLWRTTFERFKEATKLIMKGD